MAEEVYDLGVLIKHLESVWRTTSSTTYSRTTPRTTSIEVLSRKPTNAAGPSSQKKPLSSYLNDDAPAQPKSLTSKPTDKQVGGTASKKVDPKDDDFDDLFPGDSKKKSNIPEPKKETKKADVIDDFGDFVDCSSEGTG